LQEFCKKKKFETEIPRGTSCYYLGDALYKSLGKLEEGLQAYNAAWLFHERDRTQSLIESRQAASRQNIIGMERALRFRDQIMSELPNLLRNRAQAQVANGERKKARLSWREGRRRGWWPHHLQHGNTNLRRGLSARPFWDIKSSLPNSVKKAIKILSLAATQIANESMKLSQDSELWVPSDDLYVRNLKKQEGGYAKWRQVWIGTGLQEKNKQPCNILPFTCSVVKHAIETSKGVMSHPKISALWCETCEIIPHCGPTTERLRLVLPLRVPPESVYKLLVGFKSPPEPIMIGRPIVFDDSIEHTVRYVSSTSSIPRVVLLFDIRHPDL
jgi:hypothetical protein